MVKPYEIWIGANYHMSGGIRALHVLKDELQARGQAAWMLYEPPFDPDCIGIYPEIVTHNPEEYFNIVRWKLNKAHLPADGLTYAWESGMGEHPLLTVDIVEKDLFVPWTGERSGVAYWVGKGALNPTVLPAGAEEINRNNYTTRPALAQRLQTLDYLISFDPFTAVNLEAVLCGTPVLIHAPENTWSRAELNEHGWLRFGVAWDQDGLSQARADVHLAYDHYELLRQEFARRIDAFVHATQLQFN